MGKLKTSVENCRKLKKIAENWEHCRQLKTIEYTFWLSMGLTGGKPPSAKKFARPAQFPGEFGEFPANWISRNTPRGISREMAAGEFPGEFGWSPGEYRGEFAGALGCPVRSPRGISRVILVSQVHFAGNFQGRGGEFPGKYGPAQPVLVG